MTDGILLSSDSATRADMYAASRFLSGDPFDFIETNGRRILVITAYEGPRAERESSATEIWATGDLGTLELMRSGMPRDQIRPEITLRALRRAGLDRVAVPDWFPIGTAEHLRQNGIVIDVRNGLLRDRRRLKDGDAVSAMVRAQRANERSLHAARRLLAEAVVNGDGSLEHDGEPVTSERLHGVIRHSWLVDGCDGETPIVAAGAQGADPHESGHGVISTGQTIVCDLYPRTTRERMYCDMTRTLCVGTPPADLAEIHAFLLDLLQRLIAATGPGVPGRELNAMMVDSMRDGGYPSYAYPDASPGAAMHFQCPHGLGHGVGYDVHEAPSLGLEGIEELQAGDVVTLEPGLYRQGYGGVRLEDMVLVTDDGCRNLTEFPYQLGVR